MSGPFPVQVVGVGSPHGDDALGWHIVEALSRRGEVPTGVTVHRAAGGQDLLDLLDGQGTLVVVDALVPGDVPGRVQSLRWPDDRLEVLRPGSTHGVGPAEALGLAAILGRLPSRVWIFGAEAGSVRSGEGLSAAVAAAVPELVRRVEEVVGLSPASSG